MSGPLSDLAGVLTYLRGKLAEEQAKLDEQVERISQHDSREVVRWIADARYDFHLRTHYLRQQIAALSGALEVRSYGNE